MTRVSPTAYRGELTAHYLKSLGYQGNTELLDFAFAQGDANRAATVHIARMQLPCEDDGVLWFVGSLGHDAPSQSFGAEHEHQFVAIYDADDLTLCEMVASTYHFDRFVERLNYGHTFPLGKSSPLRSRGYTGAIILEGRLYQHFEDDECQISGISTRLFSVVPITSVDFQVRRERGLDALLDRWESEGRDLLHVSV